MARLGMWIDGPAGDIKKVKLWDDLKKHGIQTAAIMMEGTALGFDAKFTVAEMKKIGDMARERDIELVLTLWPDAKKAYLDEIEAELPAYIEASGCAGIEVDLEGNWKQKQVVGFPNLDKAGDRLVEILQAFRTKYDVRIEVTTFPGHAENTNRADVGNHADRLLPQAYSVVNRDVGVIPWEGSRYSPGAMQKYTLDLAKTVGAKKISCGIAAYDQSFPGHKGEEAMQVAYDAAVAYGVEEVRLWSSKWVLGVKKNGYASRWLLGLKKGK